MHVCFALLGFEGHMGKVNIEDRPTRMRTCVIALFGFEGPIGEPDNSKEKCKEEKAKEKTATNDRLESAWKMYRKRTMLVKCLPPMRQYPSSKGWSLISWARDAPDTTKAIQRKRAREI